MILSVMYVWDTPSSRDVNSEHCLASYFAGAAAMGIDSLFVAGGIHAEELGVVGKASNGIEYDVLRRVAAQHSNGVMPTYTVPFLSW